MRHKAVRLGLLFMLLLPASTLAGTGDRMWLQHIDTSPYAEQGRVRFFVDIVNTQNQVVPNLGPNAWRFFVDERAVDEASIQGLQIQTAKEVEEPLAVAFLFTDYVGFIPASEGEPSLYRGAKEGIEAFIQQLAPHRDQVGAWLYNEHGLHNVLRFTGQMELARRTLLDLPDRHFAGVLAERSLMDPEESDALTRIPEFYPHLHEVVTRLADQEDLPRRRVLVVISDGRSGLDITRKIEDSLQRSLAAAADSGVQIYTIAVSLADQDSFQYLAGAADGTMGLYQELGDTNEVEVELAATIKDLYPLLSGQYVLDLTAPDLSTDQPVAFRVDAELPTGSRLSANYPQSLRLPPYEGPQADENDPHSALLYAFLFYIGCYNLLGGLLFVAMHREDIADRVLRGATRILNEPYTHGLWGRMWTGWIASAQLFIGTIMILATRWPADAQYEVTACALGTYLLLHAVMTVGARGPRFGPGIYVTHALWFAQEAWALWALAPWLFPA